MQTDTLLVHPPACETDSSGATVAPLYQTATFRQASADGFGAFDYTRSGNPTRTQLEQQLARLEGGHRAFAFTSGMAAVTAVTRLVGAGERLVAGTDLYGGTWRLLNQLLPAHGVQVDHVDPTDAEAVRDALRTPTRLVWVETPTNPLLTCIDLRRVATQCAAAGAWLAVDSSLATPLRLKPLADGAQFVVHSGTKYLAGHTDLTAGVVVVDDPELAARLYAVQNGEGAGLAPFEAWLLLRGLKTLSLRLERQERSARALAAFLRSHPDVLEVFDPGIGAVVSFRTRDAGLARQVVERTRWFATTVSFGGVGSSISLPARFSHAAVRGGAGPPPDLVRLSVGIEDRADLQADLDAALNGAA